jgi:hypothetical protein
MRVGGGRSKCASGSAVTAESLPVRAGLYRDAVALSLATWGRPTAPEWLDEETHALCRAAIDDVMGALSGGGSLSERRAEVEVRELLGELRAAGRPLPAGLREIPRAQAALVDQLARLGPEPQEREPRWTDTPLILPALLVAGVRDAAGEALPRRPRRSARVFWSAIALALMAWGREDGVPQPEVRAALEEACEALASRDDAGLGDARARVRAGLVHATESAYDPTEHPDPAPPLEVLFETPESVVGAFERLQQADGGWRAAVEACRWAPPDAWFARRLTRLAEAGAEQAEAFRRAGEAGVRWKGSPEAHLRVQLRVAYELRADARPGPAHLWDEFDRAESDLVQTYDGVPLDVAAIAEEFARVSAATGALAEALG